METVGVNTLRKNLSVLLKKVEDGESIAITSRGHEIDYWSPLKAKWKKPGGHWMNHEKQLL